MAKFNPELGPAPQNSFASYSRGVGVNTAIGDLFEGLGKTLRTTVSAQDEVTRTNIAVDSQTGIDQILNKKPTQPVEMPEGLKQQVDQMSSYKNAKDQGVMGELEFRMRTADLAKNMRRQYGDGYADVIEGAVSGAIGRSTANQAREALLSEVNAARASEDKMYQRKLSFMQQESEIMGDPNFLAGYKKMTGQNFQFNGDFNYEAAVANVAAIKSERATLAAKKAKLEYDSAAGQQNEKLATELASVEAGKMTQSLFNKEAWPLYQQFQGAITEAMKDQKVSADEQMQISQLWNRVRTEANLRIDEMLSNPDGPYVRNITTEKGRNDIKKIVQDRLDIYESALTEKNFGIFNLVANANASIVNDQVNELMTDKNAGDVHKLLAAYKELGLPYVALEAALTKRTVGTLTGPEALQQAIGDNFIIALTGRKDVGGIVDDAVRLGLDNPKTFNDSLRKYITQSVLHEEVTPDEAALMVRSLFEDPKTASFLKDYASNDPMSLMSVMASPAMTEKLKGTVIWNKYASWAYTQFEAAGLKAANTLMDAQLTSNMGNVTYDGKQFKLEIGDSRLMQGYGDPFTNFAAGAANSWETSKLLRASQAVRDMNAYIALLEPVAKEDGVDLNQLLTAMFNGQNVGEMPKQGSLLRRMGEGLQQWLAGERGLLSPEGAPKVKTPGGGDSSGQKTPRGKQSSNKFLDFVAESEGADYNTSLAYGAFTGGEREWSKMTLDEIDAVQTQMLQHPENTFNSSAIGRYQIVRETLRGLRDELGLEGSDVFSPELQDRLAEALVKRRGRNVRGLRNEWQSLTKRKPEEILQAFDQ